MRASIHVDNPEPRLIRRAVDILLAGGIVIYPTDTVYGMGCSVEMKAAIEKIHLIKRQRPDRPFSFVCSDLTHISKYAHVSNTAFMTMKRLIPGPYTFILPATKMRSLPKILISKRKTVGIRVPDSPVAHAIVKELGHPILSTSVTTEEGEPLSDPDVIVELFNTRVDMIIDGGVLHSELSTVIDLTKDAPEIVRQGAGDVSMLT